MFIKSFREAYEAALNQKDFSYIQPYLLKDSNAYVELYEYINDLTSRTYYFNFISNEIVSLNSVSDNKIQVKTHEIFDFVNHLNKTTHYDRKKTYTIVITNDGSYLIEKITYDETKRS